DSDGMLLRHAAVVGTIAALLTPGVARGQTATQVVTFSVNVVNQVAVSGNPSPLVINSATAGSAPTSVTAGGSSYAITTNEANKLRTPSFVRRSGLCDTRLRGRGASRRYRRPAGQHCRGRRVIYARGEHPRAPRCDACGK